MKGFMITMFVIATIAYFTHLYKGGGMSGIARKKIIEKILGRKK